MHNALTVVLEKHKETAVTFIEYSLIDPLRYFFYCVLLFDYEVIEEKWMYSLGLREDRCDMP